MRGFWRGLAIFLLGGVVGTGFGVALGFFLFPYIFPPPPAAETLTEADRTKLIATGNFIQVDPSDPIHRGEGKVNVYDNVVFLEPDFEVGPGPDYHVYLVPIANVRKAEQVEKAMYVDLGRLRAFKGSQRYAIPAGVDLKNYPSVVIWCQRFSVLISPADLTPASPAKQ
jgi:Electron transfer DM13